jgi:hypothetical protein
LANVATQRKKAPLWGFFVCVGCAGIFSRVGPIDGLFSFGRLLKELATAYAVSIEWALCPFVFSGVLFLVSTIYISREKVFKAWHQSKKYCTA